MMSTMSMMNTLSTLDMMSMHEHYEHDEHDESALSSLAEHHEHDEHAEHAVVGCIPAIAFSRSIDSMNGIPAILSVSCRSCVVSCIVYLHVHDCTIPDANKLYTDALSSYTCTQAQRPCYPASRRVTI